MPNPATWKPWKRRFERDGRLHDGRSAEKQAEHRSEQALECSRGVKTSSPTFKDDSPPWEGADKMHQA